MKSLSIRDRVINWSLFLALSLIWGSSFILIDRGLQAYDAGQVAALRMSIAFLAMLPALFFFKIQWKTLPRKAVIVVGLCGSGLPALLFAVAQTKIDHSLTGILNSLVPIWVVIIGLLVFGRRYKVVQYLGVFLGLVAAVGISYYASDGKLSGDWAYAGYVMLATICYAISVNTIKEYCAGVHPIVLSLLSLGLVAGPYLVYLFSTDFIHVLNHHPQGVQSLGYLSLLAIGGTALANILFFRLVQRTSALFSSMVTYMITAVSVFWGWLDGELITLYHILGVGIIFLGIWLTRKK